jgi:DNA uptake protein ComE-like DNA-binding protein
MEAREIQHRQIFGLGRPASSPRIKNTRRRGLSLLVMLFSLWLGLDATQRLRQQATAPVDNSPPKFSVDLSTAEIGEFLLLPDVGPKTAADWDGYRSDDRFVVPSSEKELQSLPRVGIKRAQRLAPHLLDKAE